MSVSNVHIKPVAPDANASERYGSPEERAHREHHGRPEHEDAPSDRLEISRRARETYRESFFSADMDFARKALEKVPILSGSRRVQVVQRIESGYYNLPTVIWSVVSRMFPVFK